MAKKKAAGEEALVSAAKAIGKVAGKVAALAGVKPEPPTIKARFGRLVKKAKSRLPRKVKKKAARQKG